jgi:hypothetical protein
MPIDFRKNANVLAAVHEVAKPKQRTPSDPYVVDGYELHARPDLVDRLRNLMASTPEAKLEFAFGIPMLCTPTGRVFATAGGTHSLFLFLPEEETWGQPYPEYGRQWRQGFPGTRGRPHTPKDEDQLVSLMRLAYSTATKMDAAVE